MISKKQAVDTLTKSDADEATRLEGVIDRRINDYDGGTFTIGLTINPRLKVQKEIKMRYEAGGWTVEFGSERCDDPREPGTYYWVKLS